MSFKEGFIWGAATSSHQIEGAVREDGKGLSIWDVFNQKPGAVANGHTGDVDCDHYHRYKEDVALMKQIGLKAYRFSVNWPRILPDGIGRINPKGIDFYKRLVDELLKNDILPFPTLFHWDYPYELYKKGGWLSDDSSDWFSEYAGVLADALSDRVKNWLTLNETQSFVGRGHLQGLDAPGLKYSDREWLQVNHNVLLSHGKAVQAIRSRSKSPVKIGYAPVGVVSIPETETPADIEAARQQMFSVTVKNCENNTWFMDPIFFGKYPEDGVQLFGDAMPKYTDEDMRIISEPLDYFCVNIYNGQTIRAGKDGKPEKCILPPGSWVTNYNWAVTPPAMYWGPKFLYERYKKPIVITENGMSNLDWKSLDGRVRDPQRVNFLQRYLLNFQRAIEEGVDAAGYFQWSFMDNYEWSDGFSTRFGLVYTDFRTQERILKDSAYWYGNVIKTNGRSLSEMPK